MEIQKKSETLTIVRNGVLLIQRLLNHKWIASPTTDTLEELLYLANIPSSIEHKKGIKKVIQYVAKELEALGFQQLDYLRSLHSQYSSTLIAQSRPDAPLHVALVCHADTVVAPSSAKDFKIQGDLLMGPGVADNKGGILVLLQALRQISLPETMNLIVVVSANEELGSPGYNPYFKKLAQNLHAVFGFEPSLPNGDIIIERNGNYWLEVTAQGIEAHSGRCCGEELNITHDFILKYHEILNLQKKYPSVKMNIGSLQTSKDVFNIVCGDIKAKIDFRYNIEEEFQAFISQVKQIFTNPGLTNQDGSAGQFSFSVKDHCPPLEKTPDIHGFLQPYLVSLHHLESQSIQLAFSGGASDTNYLSNGKNICVDDLGPIGGNLHRRDEYVSISSLTTRANAFAKYLQHLAQEENVFSRHRIFN